MMDIGVESNQDGIGTTLSVENARKRNYQRNNVYGRLSPQQNHS